MSLPYSGELRVWDNQDRWHGDPILVIGPADRDCQAWIVLHAGTRINLSDAFIAEWTRGSSE